MTVSNRYQPKIVFFGLLCALVLLAGCTSKPKEPQNVQRYPIEGKVIAVNAPTKEITLQHQDIPGYMKGMTMPFRVQDEWVFNVARPGDELHGTLAVSPDRAYITDVSINQGAALAAVSSTSKMHSPEVGEAVPDFSFVDQNGRRLHLQQFRGKPLLLTFIYTRCPLPDFCIRMSNNFGQLAREMKQAAPAVYGRLQLLSISIDPEYDKPSVLMRYGKSVRRRRRSDLRALAICLRHALRNPPGRRFFWPELHPRKWADRAFAAHRAGCARRQDRGAIPGQRLDARRG
jgi:protein SCO1/2